MSNAEFAYQHMMLLRLKRNRKRNKAARKARRITRRDH